ncbi:UNVERIFIED_CONTAM: hypothetical protein RMT77_015605 [Armadillidium vulgare]
MDNFASLQISEVTDQTILSGLGSQGLDLSIGTVNYREPNAASTAVNYERLRENYLQSCLEQEIDYFKCPENFFLEKCPSSEKLNSKDATPSSNVPDEFIDLKEVTHALSKESSLTHENIVMGSISNDSRNSNLFPGSSILNLSKLVSFSDTDEIDLKRETTQLFGLPSYLIGDQNKTEKDSQITTDDGDEEEISKPWGNESSFGLEVNRLQGENSSPVWEAACKEKNFSEFSSPFGSAINESRKNPFDQEEMKQDDDFSNLEFHNLDSRELSLDEEKALKQDSFYIGSSFTYASNKSEFSGINNPDDISLKSTFWNMGSNEGNPKEKITIEDIFKAKSTKPSFGFDLSDKISFYLENELEKPLEMPVSSSSSTNSFTTQVSSNPLDSAFPDQKQFLNPKSDSGSEARTVPSVLGNNQQDSSLNLDTLREMMGKMSHVNDLQDIIKRLSQPHKDDTSAKESFLLDNSAEILEMEIKKYEERLSRIIYKDDPQPQTSYSHFSKVNKVNVRNIDIPVSSFNKLDEANKNITDHCKQTSHKDHHVVDAIHRGNSYQLSASSGWSVDDPKNSSELIKESDANKNSPFIGSKIENCKQGNVISKFGLTGIRTDIEYQFKNPTSELLAVSLKQVDEVFQHANSLQSFKQDYYQFDYPRFEYLYPNCYLNLCFSFCSLMPGVFATKIGLCGSVGKEVNQILVSQSLHLYITVERPDICVTCENEEKVDFGLVPECCTVRKNILIFNKSKHSIPIFVNLKPICESSEILTWVENQQGIKLVSPSLAACEIEAESTITLIAQFSAPSVDILRNILGTAQSNGFFETESSLEVTLDSPFKSILVLSQIPVKIRIGEVQLRTQRSVLPLKVESIDGQMGSCTCTLRNKSLFPLDLTVKLSDHEQFLSIYPERLSIPSQGDSTIEIRFSPHNIPNLNIEVKLLILVEPEGMQMDLPLVASLTQSSIPKEQIPTPVIVEDCTTKNQVSNLQPVNLLTNGHYCMFGSVPIGESKPYKFIIQNGWSDNSLVLQICIQKNDAFYFSELEDGSRILSKEVKLEPKEKLNLMINFTPSKRELYLGSLMCIYKNALGKTTFPLYGFGGSGDLILKYGESLQSESEEIYFGNLTPNLPTLIKLTGTNTGSRYIFVKLAIFPDENSDHPFPPFDICVQPSLLILGPEETKEIIIICMNTISIIEKTFEKFGILRVIYGDEILRRRFRSHNDTKLKRKKINNPRLLMVNFHEEILQENCAFKDEENDDKCPSLSDDSIVFYNSCKILNIPLCREIAENDISTTMINAGVDLTTMKSFMIKNMEKLMVCDKENDGTIPQPRIFEA